MGRMRKVRTPDIEGQQVIELHGYDALILFTLQPTLVSSIGYVKGGAQGPGLYVAPGC